jgi:hypothetical protein
MPEANGTSPPAQAVAPGKLELVEKQLMDPQPGHVRIRAEACLNSAPKSQLSQMSVCSPETLSRRSTEITVPKY